MTSGTRPSKSSRSSRRGKPGVGSRSKARPSRTVALAKVKDDFSRYLRLASQGEVLITRHGRPAGVLIGFEDEEAWVNYRIENHPEFLERVAAARKAMREGRGVRLEDV